MQFTASVLFGIALGAVLYALAHRADRIGAPGSLARAWPRWAVLVLGVAGAGALLAAMPAGLDADVLMRLAIGLPTAGVVFAAGRLIGGDRCWQVWTGLVFAAVPALFWVWFVLAEAFVPA